MYDIIIIGAGVIGCSIAYELRKLNKKILVLEKHEKVAQVQSKYNSNIIHSGNDPLPNTLKARLNVEGNRIYEEWEKELNIPIKHTKAMIVALSEEEVIELDNLNARGIKNGLLDTFIISGEKARMLEPNLSENIIEALFMPSTKIIDPYQVSKILMKQAINEEVRFEFDEEVISINNKLSHYIINTKKSVFRTKSIINASGISAVEIAKMLNETLPIDMEIIKGEYIQIQQNKNNKFNHVIYPISTTKSKGILIVPLLNETILIGPTSIVVEDANANEVSLESIDFIKETSKKYLKQSILNSNEQYIVGMRSSTKQGDFYIETSKTNKNVIHLAGIDSPGLSAAPAIGKYVAKMVLQHFDLSD